MKSEIKEQIADGRFPAAGANANHRSEALAARLEAGASALAAFAASLSKTEWQQRSAGDGKNAP